jgi:hypothetical protein
VRSYVRLDRIWFVFGESKLTLNKLKRKGKMRIPIVLSRINVKTTHEVTVGKGTSGGTQIEFAILISYVNKRGN